MLIIEVAKIELNGGHFGIMLFMEIAKKEFNGGYFGIKLIIEIAKTEINLRPNWNYAIYRDCQNRIK